MVSKAIHKEIVESYIKRNGLSDEEFCKLCGITLKTFKRMMDTNISAGKVKLKYIVSVSLAIGVRFSDLVE